MSPSPPWPPTRFCEPLESFATSTGVARVRTDAGDVFVKALGNKEGPQTLRRYVERQGDLPRRSE